MRSLSEELVGIPVSGVRYGCRKAMVEGVVVMMGCHSGRIMMAEQQVLWCERGGVACIGAMQVMTISQLY